MPKKFTTTNSERRTEAVGFIGRLAKQAATRAIDIALARVFPVDIVQSTRQNDKNPQLQKNGPERVVIAQARSPEVCPSMSEALAKKTTEQQAPAQEELPWKKYERDVIPDDHLSSEQMLRQERRRKRREDSLSREALERELELERREVGYGCRIMIQATLPHSDPNRGIEPGDPSWRGQFTRKNGNLSLTIQAREEFGFPYGTYPRLLTAWIATEAVRTKERQLVLGTSLRDFLERLDLSPTAGKRGTIPRLRNQMLRFFTSTFSATEQADGRIRDVGFRPVSKMDLFWDSRNVNQTSLWQSTIVLSEDFFEELVKRPVPLDMRALKSLAKSKSPMALDIYAWLTFRYSYLSESTLIPWELLALQFGGDYGRERDFKRKFVGQLASVKGLYSDAKFEVTPEGLRLFPSRPHVRLLRA